MNESEWIGEDGNTYRINADGTNLRILTITGEWKTLA